MAEINLSARGNLHIPVKEYEYYIILFRICPNVSVNQRRALLFLT